MDGNKRTGAITSLVFLCTNHFDIEASDAELATLYEQIAGGDIDEDDVIEWYEERTYQVRVWTG